MSERRKILIVDDIELNRAILGEVFAGEYDVLEAENGVQALEQYNKNRSCLAVMLLDVVMPVMNGIAVLEALKQRGLVKQVPIVMITAEPTEEVLLRGYEMGVADVIRKPFNTGIVKQRIGNIVELYSYRNRLESLVKSQMAELEAQAEKIKQSNSFLVDALSTVVEFRDMESGEHIRRIRNITKVLIEALNARTPNGAFSEEEIEDICTASALHDIGKIAVPDAILTKPGKLTAEEFEIMKTHTTKGCEMLNAMPYVRDQQYFIYCYEICRYHHERWDGTGYPDGLKGDDIPIWAQVVSIADVYDALISKRVYKDAYSHEQAAKMIANGECGKFNPLLLQCFDDCQERLRRVCEGENSEAGAPMMVFNKTTSNAGRNYEEALKSAIDNTVRKRFELLDADGESMKNWIASVTDVVVETMEREVKRMLDAGGKVEPLSADESVRDALTGLYNLDSFMLLGFETLKRESDMTAAVEVLGISNMEQITQLYGQKMSERVLCAMAEGFSSCFRGTDLTARTGPNEFAVLLRNVKSMDAVKNKARDMIKAQEDSFVINGMQIPLEVDVGVAEGETGCADMERMLGTAREAMMANSHRAYPAKEYQHDFFE